VVLMLIIFFMPEGLVGLPKRLKALNKVFIKTRNAMGKADNA